VWADTIITVTTTGDTIIADGLCSLREAIVAANTDAAFNGCPAGRGADTIVFSSSLPQPITITLTKTGANEDNALTGDLDVAETLTLDGPGSITIDGNATDRVFEILPGAQVAIHDLKIQHGNPGVREAGGGIAVDLTGVLTLTNSIVISNTATDGGGIKVLGRLTLTDSQVESNQGGGISNDGGLLNLDTAQIMNNAGGYGVRNQNQASLTFNSGSVSGNQGGGIYNSTSSATLSRLSILNNTSGGGVYNSGGTLTRLIVNSCTVMTNTATSGGGIFNAGVGANATVNDTRIRGNSATGAGGGLYNNGVLTLNRSTVDNNQARTGGGIDHAGGNLYLTNDTVSGNTAGDNGGGIYNRGSAILSNVTFADNVANGLNTGGNIFNDEAELSIKSSIVAYSQADGNCANSAGFLNSLGHNLESGSTCGFSAPGDLVNTDPLLGPLQNNGGPTPTRALLHGSPAIDQGDNSGCPATDQRGIARPQGAACDIGAYESGGTADLSLGVSVSPFLVGLRDTMTYTLVISNPGPSLATTLELTDTLPHSVTFINATMGSGGTCTHSGDVVCSLPGLDAGARVTATIAVTAPATTGIISNTARVRSTVIDLDPENNTVTTLTPIHALRVLCLPLILGGIP
jgi:CSLREA domain-containing protein/uncharacterized repeat protein (TIGR01451 family)